MTTTYDAEFNTETIAAAPYDDPDTYTIAEAWASSGLDGPDENGYHVAKDEAADDRRQGDRAKLFAVLASGIIGGAMLGAVLFGSIEPAKPTFIVPNSGVSTSPLPSAVSAPPSSTPAAPSKSVAVAPAPKPVGQAPAPKPVAPKPEPAPPAPSAVADPGTPAVSAPPVVINIPIPPLPPLQPLPDPDPPAQEEPPAPEPPVFNPPNIDVVQVAPQPGPISPKPELQVNEDLLPKQIGSRWTTKLPENKPDSRRVNTGTSSRATLAKP